MSKKKKKDYDGSNQKAAYFFFSQAFFVCSTKTQEEASEELSGVVVVAGVVSMSKLREWQNTRNGCQKLWFEADLYQIASRAFHILLKKNAVLFFFFGGPTHSSFDCLGLLFQKNCLEAAAVEGGRVE